MVQIPMSKQLFWFIEAKFVPSGKQLWIKLASRAAFVGFEVAHTSERGLEGHATG